MKWSWQTIINISVALTFTACLYLVAKVSDLKDRTSALRKQNSELRAELRKYEMKIDAKHERELLRIHIKSNKDRIRSTRQLTEAMISVQGEKARHSLWAQDEMLRILGLPPYNYPNLSPRGRNAKTIYHRFRSWQGKKGYHFCCIAREPSKKSL